MKSILVPVEQHEAAAFALHLAALTAIRFAGTVEGFALQVPPLTLIGWDPASVALMNSSEWDHRRVMVGARALFQKAMEEHSLARDDSSGTGNPAACWRWDETPMAGESFLGSYARAFDLTVVGQPRANGSSITTLEAALFDSGGPILIAPPRPVTTLGETVVIGGNGSTETARTIAFAKPFLRRAKRVVILADEGSLGHQPPGELILRRLEQNGIAAELKLLPDGRIRSGEVILEQATALGCDLLVKGAYTQSRLRQMIFGGATNHVLAHADMPVFMAH